MVHYYDCMDEERGLPSIPDNSIDLCLTDPPYNVKYEGKRIKTKKVTTYFDEMSHEDYKNWCKLWFKEVSRICREVIFTPGNINLCMWAQIEEWIDLGFHYKPASCSRASAAHYCVYDSILFYGKPIGRLDHLVIKTGAHFTKFTHPAVKNFQLWFKILKQLNPNSVLDPFIGSGTTAEACVKLGIPYIGYEVNEVYRKDIESRLRGLKKLKKQGRFKKMIPPDRLKPSL